MPNDYLAVIGKRDAERFRRFRTGYDADIIKNMTEFSDAENIWALGPSISDDLWSAIQKNDRIFFAERGYSFTRCGTVSRKTVDQAQAIKIWGDTPRMREHKRLILFSSVYETNILFHKLCREKDINSSSNATYFYASKDNAVGIVPDGLSNEITGTIIVSDDGVPNKKTEVVTRFVRDTKKVQQLKAIYHDECQVCGYAIQLSPGSKYSEVHHIHPLKDGGDDDFDNMLVLCPTHHVEFDYKIVGINSDGKTVFSKNSTLGKLTMNKQHHIAMKNIKFHLERMNKK